MKNQLWILAVAVLMWGCQDPTPIEGSISDQKIVPDFVPPVITFKSETTLFCAEGQTCKLNVVASVPEPGTPLIRFDRLPKDAVYDPVSSQIIWSPSYDAINVDRVGAKTSESYEVDGLLVSSADSKLMIRQPFQFILSNTLRDVEFAEVGNSKKPTEGTAYEYTFKVSSPDFPSGRISVFLDSAPEGMTLVPNATDSSLYTVQYTPPYHFVQLGDSSKKLQFWIKWIVPLGSSGKSLVSWSIEDARLAPQVISPDEITIDRGANFVVRVEDRNSEEQPVFNPGVLENPTLTIEAEKILGDFGKFVSYYNIQVHGIGEESIGQDIEIPYMACTLSIKSPWGWKSDLDRRTLCTPKVTTLHVVKNRSSK